MGDQYHYIRLLGFGTSQKRRGNCEAPDLRYYAPLPSTKILLCGLEALLLCGEVVLHRWGIGAKDEGHQLVGAISWGIEQFVCSKASFHLLGGHRDEGGEVVDPLGDEVFEIVL